MLDSISGSQSIGDGLRVSGRSQASGGLKVNATATNSSALGSRSSGASEHFKASILSRVERFQKSGRTENTSAESAQALVDSVGQAAAEVKTVMGQEAANAFMAKVLTGLDKNGFSLEGLTDSVGSALRDVGQAESSSKVKQLTESFNKDLSAPADDKNGRAVKSLSRAIGDFFGLEKTASEKGSTAEGFTKDGRWGEVEVADEESGTRFLKGTEEAAEQALSVSAAFSLGELGSDTKNDLVDFLRQELGAEEAAAYLESQGDGADFMGTMDTVITKALEEVKDPATAAKLEQYLNDQIKTAVNAVVGTQRNPFGDVEFEGWDFSQGAAAIGEDGQPVAGATEFSSKWRYTNRDDVTYTRSGRVQAQTKKETEQTEEEETGSSMADLVKKVADRTSAKTGELVDTTA